MSRVTRFAKLLEGKLEESRTLQQEIEGCGLRVCTRGYVPIGQHRGAIQIEIDVQKPRIFEEPPTVRFFDEWVRRDVNWHTYVTDDPWDVNRACWIHQQKWRELLLRSGRRDDVKVEAAADILFQWVKKLLARHRIGYEKGWTEWPARWLECPHDLPPTAAEYENEQADANNHRRFCSEQRAASAWGRRDIKLPKRLRRTRI